MSTFTKIADTTHDWTMKIAGQPGFNSTVAGVAGGATVGGVQGSFSDYGGFFGGAIKGGIAGGAAGFGVKYGTSRYAKAFRQDLDNFTPFTGVNNQSGFNNNFRATNKLTHPALKNPHDFQLDRYFRGSFNKDEKWYSSSYK